MDNNQRFLLQNKIPLNNQNIPANMILPNKYCDQKKNNNDTKILMGLPISNKNENNKKINDNIKKDKDENIKKDKYDKEGKTKVNKKKNNNDTKILMGLPISNKNENNHGGGNIIEKFLGK